MSVSISRGLVDRLRKRWQEMSVEVIVFVVAASLAGGLSMGAVTWIYFLDKWRSDPERSSAPPPRSVFEEPGEGRLDEAA
jgi:hypothetical protein